MTKCECGATTEGKWADVHDPKCAALATDRPLTEEENEMIEAAFERHKSAGGPDWPPQVSSIGLPEGHLQRGSTGQPFEVRNGRWARLFSAAR